jgi:hypothetical protein
VNENYINATGCLRYIMDQFTQQQFCKTQIDTTVSTIVLLVVGGNAVCFDPYLETSSGVQEYWY